MKKYYENIQHRRTLRHINSNHLLIMERLSQLLVHGFTFAEAMKFIYDQLQIKNKRFHSILINALNQGASCYEVFRILGYPQTVLLQLYFAEKYGSLPETLQLCHQFYSKNRKLKKQFVKTIQYPIVLIFIFFALITTLNHTVMPQFNQMYDNMQLEASLLQKIIKAFIQNFPLTSLALLLCLTAIFFLVRHFFKQLTVRQQIQWINRFPFLRKYYKLYNTYHITNHFVLFFKNGITLNDIVQIYIHQQESLFLTYIGRTLQYQLQNGVSFSTIFTQLNCFENQFIHYIQHGEMRDKLDVELQMYSIFLLDHIEYFLHQHIKWIQPIMFTLIGLLVLCVYLVMMLPIFEMMQTIKE